MGKVYPHSDLYALAATVLVLLTGKEPQELIDSRTFTWHWRQEINLTPMLGTLLDKMLSPQMGNRYQTAQQVLQVISNYDAATTGFTTPSTGATLAIAPAEQPAAIVAEEPAFNKAKFLSTWGKFLLVFPLIVGAASAGWWAVNSLLQFKSAFLVRTPENVQKQPRTVPTPQFSATEQQRKNQLRDRRQQLGINYKFYIQLVDRAFWEKYPQYRGRRLSVKPEDEALRVEWDNMAAQIMDRLQPLSPAARQQLGRYTAKDRSRWRSQINQLHLSSRALYDLADAAFFELFPQQRGKNFMNQPISQVWYALADEKIKAMLDGTAYDRIVFDLGITDKQLGGNLKPGDGKAYVAELTREQAMQLELQANSQVLISVYSPTGKIKLMEDSSDRTWAGELPESGFYEFTLVSTASRPMDYQLKLSVE